MPRKKNEDKDVEKIEEKLDEEIKEDVDTDTLDEVVQDMDGDEAKDISDFDLEPEENPHVDDFTASNEGGVPPVTSIQVSEEDRLRILVAQLQIENLELESKVTEQKHARKVDELNRLVADYKTKYEVPEGWKLNPVSGTFNMQP